MTEHADAAPEKAPVKRKRRLFGRMWLLLFACLAPMTIVAMSIGVLNHHRVRAETIHKTVPATAQAGPPAIVGMNAEGPAPSETASASALEDVLEIAKSGDAGAMRDAGLKYLAGDGAERNDAQAARWLLRAAYKGEAVAQYWLGTLYARGQGVPADAEQANHWYEAAAKKGNRRAMHALGVAALEGLGRDKDAHEAARWFREAAALGSVDSAFNLAVLYERGEGVTQSLTDAVTWYGIAAASGDAAARSRRNALAARLTPATRALAEQAAESFKPKPADARANVASLSGH